MGCAKLNWLHNDWRDCRYRHQCHAYPETAGGFLSAGAHTTQDGMAPAVQRRYGTDYGHLYISRNPIDQSYDRIPAAYTSDNAEWSGDQSRLAPSMVCISPVWETGHVASVRRLRSSNWPASLTVSSSR